MIQAAVSFFRKREKKRPFEAFQIEVTSRCNLKCVMCPVTVLADRWPARDMAWETFERAAESFGQARWIHLQGWGEPMLHRRLFDMIAAGKRAGCRVGFTTNGTRLTRENGERLLELGLDLMAVSIAGARPATHAAVRAGSDLEKLLENLRAFVSLRRARGAAAPKLEIFYLMTPDNLAELPEAVQLVADLGADELVATNLDYVMTPGLDSLRAYGEGPPARALEAALDEARATARKCGLALRSYPLAYREMAVCDLNPLKILFISADGAVSPCVYTSLAGQAAIPRVFGGRAVTVPVVQFGNLSEQPLAEIWKGAAYREFRALFAERALGASRMLLGAAGGAPVRDAPAPEACRTCPKLYGV